MQRACSRNPTHKTVANVANDHHQNTQRHQSSPAPKGPKLSRRNVRMRVLSEGWARFFYSRRSFFNNNLAVRIILPGDGLDRGFDGVDDNGRITVLGQRASGLCDGYEIDSIDEGE